MSQHYQPQTVRAANEAIVLSMFHGVAAALPEPADVVVADLEARHNTLVARHASAMSLDNAPCTEAAPDDNPDPDNALDDRVLGHVVFATGLLAAYERACEHLPAADAMALVRTSMIGPIAESIRVGTADVLDRAGDAFTTMVGFCRDREVNYFGPSFGFARIRDDDAAYHLAVTGCMYHRVLSAAGAGELTRIACDWDENTWGAAIDPDRHGFTFRLPATIGRGASRCQFLFDRAAAADDHTVSGSSPT